MRKIPTKGSFKAKALFIDMKPTSYHTKFRAGALRDVADHINSQGLPLLLVHNAQKLPVGAWYSADIYGEELFAKFFVPSNISEHDDIKARVEASILDSVSIGFSANIHECSVCGNDIQDYQACSHIPGKEYVTKDPETGLVTGTETCYVMLDDIQVKEGSLVYAGAVQRAKILEHSSKEEFFTSSGLNFSESQTEIIHSCKVTQYSNVNSTSKENNMDPEELSKLQGQVTAFQQKIADLQGVEAALSADKLDLTGKYNDAREELLSLKEANIANAEKLLKYDAAIEEAATAKTELEAFVARFGEQVTKLAVPFKADYTVPNDIEALYADLDTYLEQAKTLPSGRQSREDDAAQYVEPDTNYKV